jgi:hypothetical protein
MMFVNEEFRTQQQVSSRKKPDGIAHRIEARFSLKASYDRSAAPLLESDFRSGNKKFS